MDLSNLIDECFTDNKNEILNMTDEIKTKHFDKLKGYTYVRDISTLNIGDNIKYVDLDNIKASPNCRISNIVYKKMGDIKSIQKFELKFIIPCDHAICKKTNYKYITENTKCQDVKYFKFILDPKKFHVFTINGLNNRSTKFFDDVVHKYKIDKKNNIKGI
jgi:hypothetical protein